MAFTEATTTGTTKFGQFERLCDPAVAVQRDTIEGRTVRAVPAERSLSVRDVGGRNRPGTVHGNALASSVVESNMATAPDASLHRRC